MVYSSSKDEGTIDREIFLKDDRDGIVALEDSFVHAKIILTIFLIEDWNEFFKIVIVLAKICLETI